MRIRSALLFTLALGLPLMACAQDFDRTEITERSFKIDEGQTVTLDADLGRVDLRGANTDEIEVRVIEGTNNMSRERSEELFERHEIDFRETRGGLEIFGDYDGDRSWRRNRRLHVVYEITVPHDMHVDLKTSGGSILVEAIEGDAALRTSGGSIKAYQVGGVLEARTSGGSIEAIDIDNKIDVSTSGGSITLENIADDARCRTSGGSIRANDVRGEVNAQTSGGSIRLMGIHGAVDAQTSGGSIVAEMLNQPDHDMSLRTSGGSVTLHLPDDINAEIDAQASGGRVRSDLPILVRGEIKRSHLRGTMGDGGPMLVLRSSGGSVNLREL